MKRKKFYQDKDGDDSGKRLTGFILLGYALIVTTFDGFQWFDVDETIVITLLSLAAAMLSLDSVTDIWKQNTTNGGRNYRRYGDEDKNTTDEPD